jgi:hypothetical protein
VVTWPEGNGRLVAHLRERSGARILLGTAAVDLLPRAGGGVDVTALTDGGEPLCLRADQAIFAAPQFLGRRFVRGLHERAPVDDGAFQYGSWMVANLTLREHPRGAGFPLAWDNVLYESPSLGYVVATHQSGRDAGPTVITYYYPLCDDDPRAARRRLLAIDRDGWADIALADLERAHPEIRLLVTRLDVMRWGHAMIRPRPGFLFGPERARAAQAHRGIHFAHSDLSGVALFEEALHRGVAAAEAVLAERGLPSPSMQ